MKTIVILSTFLCLFNVLSYSQSSTGSEEENGTIYIKHPYIDVVNKTVEAYLAKDTAAEKKLYADTARLWVSGLEKSVPISEAYKMWLADFTNFDSVKLVKQPGSYPDYLHYKDGDQKTVISYWRWSGKSKKTGEMIKVYYIALDNFNSAGKIEFESLNGDFSKMLNN